MSLDDLQAQLRGALDQQFSTLKQQYDEAVAAAREQARVEAEQQAARGIASARAELEAQMAAIVSATRAEAKQDAEATARAQVAALEHELQQQLEQTVQHAVNSVRRSSEMEAEAQRRRHDAALQAERERSQAALDTQRQETEQAVSAQRLESEQALAAATQRGDQADAERQRLEQELAAERQRLEGIEAERQRLEGELAAERQRRDTELAAERERLEAEVATERRQRDEALAAERDRAGREIAGERERAEQLLAAERGKWQQDLDAERARITQIETLRQQLETDLATARAETAAAVEASAAHLMPAVDGSAEGLARLPQAIRSLDAAPSLSQVLEALLQHAGAIAGRAALFLVNGDRLKPWKTAGIPEIDVQSVESSITARDLLGRAIQSGHPTPASADLPAPPFARLAAGQPSLAVPLMIGGRAVAVLYADAGAESPDPAWSVAVELAVRHASAVAAVRSAMRTFDVLRGGAADPGLASDAPSNGGTDDGARRYARLLVSEIKLYNEAEVRAGRQQRDLRQRLRGQIDRAQRLYEERVPPAVSARAQYFQQELVQTLADGDPTLLGH